MTDLKLGALLWNQYTTWPELLAGGQRAERLGFDTLWTWDHLYPIIGSSEGPILEGWSILAAWSQATERIRLGLTVGANTFREPSVTAKMATTLDHLSSGRAILGIGAAWFEEEHIAYGLPFGDGPPERLRWLGEALPIMRGMLHGERPTATGPRYHAKEVMNLPPPIQETLPILIGGAGEKVTLKLVARYADMNNLGGGFEKIQAKERILLQHCEAVGRDPSEIERTATIGMVIIRDSREEAIRVQAEIYQRHGHATRSKEQPVGTVEDVAERAAPLIGLGYRHLIAGFPGPHDEESMTRFATEVRAILERS